MWLPSALFLNCCLWVFPCLCWHCNVTFPCPCVFVGRQLDVDIETLSREIIDKRPGAGQSWVVNTSDPAASALESTSAAVVRTMRLALNSKAEKHVALLAFLRTFGLWELTSAVARRRIAEHGEKLAAAIALVAVECECPWLSGIFIVISYDQWDEVIVL